MSRTALLVGAVLLLAVAGTAHTGGGHANLSEHPDGTAENDTGITDSPYASDDPVVLGGVLAFLGLTSVLAAVAIRLHHRAAQDSRQF